MFAAGIDVSKEKLDVTLLGGKAPWVGTFSNTAKGCRALVKAVQKRTGKGPVRSALEPTATYHLTCATVLHAAGIEIMLVNPFAASSMAKAVGQRGKTDRADSAMLAEFALRDDFKAWSPPDKPLVELRVLVRRRAQLVRSRTKEKNRAKEILSTGVGELVLDDVQATIAFLDERIAKLEEAIKALVSRTESLRKAVKLVATLPGVGDIIASVTIAELGAMPVDLTPRQLVAMAGLDPTPKQSGMMDGKRKVSKRGNKHLRTAMYLAAWSAPRSCPHVRAWHEAMLAKGKPKKVVTVALSRRLLLAAAAILKSGDSWDGQKFSRLAP
jgi:transposase